MSQRFREGQLNPMMMSLSLLSLQDRLLERERERERERSKEVLDPLKAATGRCSKSVSKSTSKNQSARVKQGVQKLRGINQVQIS